MTRHTIEMAVRQVAQDKCISLSDIQLANICSELNARLDLFLMAYKGD